MKECVACFRRTNAVTLPCAHPLCPACARKWMQRQSTCPTCRQPIDGVVRVYVTNTMRVVPLDVEEEDTPPRSFARTLRTAVLHCLPSQRA